MKGKPLIGSHATELRERVAVMKTFLAEELESRHPSKSYIDDLTASISTVEYTLKYGYQHIMIAGNTNEDD